VIKQKVKATDQKMKSYGEIVSNHIKQTIRLDAIYLPHKKIHVNILFFYMKKKQENVSNTNGSV
jgi:hypothetical protein